MGVGAGGSRKSARRTGPVRLARQASRMRPDRPLWGRRAAGRRIRAEEETSERGGGVPGPPGCLSTFPRGWRSNPRAGGRRRRPGLCLFFLTATHLKPPFHSSGQRALVKPRLKHAYELVLITVVKLGGKLGSNLQNASSASETF